MNTAKMSQFRIMTTLVAVLLVIAADDVNCQKIDSLESLLNGKIGLARYKVLFNLGYEYVDIDDVIALQYATLAFRESQKNGDSLNIVQSGRLLSLVFRRLGEIDSSIIVSTQVLPIARRNNFMKELKTVLSGLALAYTHKAYYDKALNHYFEAISLEENMGDNYSKGVVLNNIGLVYYKMTDYQKALSYFNEALKLHDVAKLKENLNTFYVNITLCNAYLGNFSEAQKNVALAVDACQAGCPELAILQTKYCQGVLHYKQNELLKAESQFLDSYSISRKLDNKRFQLDNIVYLAEIYISS